MTIVDVGFPSMGSEARLVIQGGLDPQARADRCRAFLVDFEARLSRFRDDSELTRLNASAAEINPASRLLRGAIRAGLWAARRTNGLVDPTLIGPLKTIGYDHSRSGPGLPLAEALRTAPHRAPAGPDPARRWSQAGWTTATATSCARPDCASTRAARARASPPTCSRTCWRAVTAGRRTAAATCAWAAQAPPQSPSRSR